MSRRSVQFSDGVQHRDSISSAPISIRIDAAAPEPTSTPASSSGSPLPSHVANLRRSSDADADRDLPPQRDLPSQRDASRARDLEASVPMIRVDSDAPGRSSQAVHISLPPPILQLPMSPSSQSIPQISAPSPFGSFILGDLHALAGAHSPSFHDRSSKTSRSIHGFHHERLVVAKILRQLARPRTMAEDAERKKPTVVFLDGPVGSGKSVLEADYARTSKALLLTTVSAHGHKTARCVPLRPFHDMLVELLKLRPNKDSNFKERNCTYIHNSTSSRRKSMWQPSGEAEVSEKDRLPVQIRVAATSHGTSTFLQKLLPGWADFEAAPIPNFDHASVNSDDIYHLLTRKELIQILTSLLKSASRQAPVVSIF